MRLIFKVEQLVTKLLEIMFRVSLFVSLNLILMLIREFIVDNNYIANQLALSLTGYPDASETLTCVANCLTSGGYTPIPVTPRCTDFSSGMDITVGQRTDDVVLDNGSYFHVAFQSKCVEKFKFTNGWHNENLEFIDAHRFTFTSRWNVEYTTNGHNDFAHFYSCRCSTNHNDSND